MARDDEGAWKATVLFAARQTRIATGFLIDGSYWENSWSAPEVRRHPFGSEEFRRPSLTKRFAHASMRR